MTGGLKNYTIWYLDKEGQGHKQYRISGRSLTELHEELSQKHEEVLIWPGNWFGMAPDNQAEPDDHYGIPEDRR
jgi:hypothetical protein